MGLILSFSPYSGLVDSSSLCSYESIATSVGAGTSASIDFTSIPATYTHLQIRFFLRSVTASTGNTWGSVSLNSDTTNSNYSMHQMNGDGATAAAQGFDSTSNFTRYAFMYPQASNTYSSWAGGIMDILDYANTNKHKTIRTIHGDDRNGSGIVMLTSNRWGSASAVTAVSLIGTGGNFAQYSHAALYGLKG
jgi:hypothetical protein